MIDITGWLVALSCLWLAVDYHRQRSRWFSLLFGLLALERLTGLTPLPTGDIVLGGVGLPPTALVSVGLALVLGRVVVGRLLYLLIQRRGVNADGDAG